MSYNPFSLAGKTILVTGASSGIGRATAIECAKMGANLIITARNEERLNETFVHLDVKNGQVHKVVIADLREVEQLENLIFESGEIDGLVLSSGKGLTLPFQFSSRDKFDDIFETNFYAPVELMRLLYKKRQINKKGAVVIVSSIGGTENFNNGYCVYGASKAALNSIMKFCAKEFASKKIRVNSVCPGRVDTPLISNRFLSEEDVERDIEQYPMKRYGKPEEVAFAIIYLLSDASAWVTGTNLVIDGGRSLK